MIKCKHCDKEKPESEMAVRAGKPSKVCIACKESKGSRKKPKAAAGRSKKADDGLSFEVPAGGHGFKAALTDEDTLLITQVNPEAEDDNVVLTRYEAKQLFGLFAKWAAES